jgi:TolB protein
MKAARFLCSAAVIAVAVFASMPASAQYRQDLVLRYYQLPRLAVPDFIAGSSSEADSAHAISEIIAKDLNQTNVFAPIDTGTFIDKTLSIDRPPEFADWRAKGIQGLLVGRVTRQPDDRIKVEFRLWDITAGLQFTGQQYLADPADLSRIGHMISVEIYQRVTGKKRTFD